jgi:hypothetical protein
MPAIPSQTVQVKAGTYLLSKHVDIDVADKAHGMFLATVQGSNGSRWTVTHLPESGWRCDCPANRYQSRMCAHLTACRAVFRPAKEG